MTHRPLVDLLVHADWSVSPKKRWAARAEWAAGWTVTSVEPVGPTAVFVADLLTSAATRRVLAGFDFPIGLPNSYGAKTGEANFSAFLRGIGTGRWSRFADIARTADEISIERPFYPAGSTGGVTQAALIDGHGEAVFDDLRRQCERATAKRRAACPIFWTLGGNQVGRGALSGWVEVVKPAQAGGASVWPFDGTLEHLSQQPGLVIAETYPAEAYGHVGVRFAQAESKTNQSHRKSKADAIHAWADRHGVRLAASVISLIDDGFGDTQSGEDQFDALMGLLGMIEVADGRRSAAPPGRVTDPWEGWMIGQAGGEDHGTTPSKPSTNDMRTSEEPTFPGYLEVIEPLSAIPTLPSRWVDFLRQGKGVYLLTCPRTKEQYVGKADGVDGFWGRWLSYAMTGDGGNVRLKSRERSDYQVSILEVAGSAATADEILRMEMRWKAKLQTREMGLNGN